MSPGIPTRLLATQSDERLLALVRQGHERAFEALVHRYRKPLLSYCRRLLADARAEDIVQLALLKTWIAVREGAEIRDIKAWLYRVVHNTAVNAVRDAAHEGESFADPAHRLGAEELDIDRRLNVREALAEVAALPPLQREVIVRTAVAGHSHEQVASDLGITGGAVRGLLYRARVTLRTAITALTPPPLLGWLAGRADQSGPAPERLTELAGGGGTVGLGGLLLKGGVVAITAGTVITGAAVVHVDGSIHHRDRHRLIATAPPAGATAATAEAHLGALGGGGPPAGSRPRRAADRSGQERRRTSATNIHAAGGTRFVAVAVGAPGGRRVPHFTAQPRGDARGNAPGSGRAVQSPPSNPVQGSSEGAGPSQSGGSGQSEGSGAGGQAGPVGSVAGSGSGSSAGASGPAGQGSGEAGGDAPGGGQSGAGSGASTEGSSSQGSSSGSEPSGTSSGGQEGGSGGQSLVGAVVHEVASVLEHVLH